MIKQGPGYVFLFFFHFWAEMDVQPCNFKALKSFNCMHFHRLIVPSLGQFWPL